VWLIDIVWILKRWFRQQISEWVWVGWIKLTGEKASTRRWTSVPLCSPQTSHGLTGDRTRPPRWQMRPESLYGHYMRLLQLWKKWDNDHKKKKSARREFGSDVFVSGMIIRTKQIISVEVSNLGSNCSHTQSQLHSIRAELGAIFQGGWKEWRRALSCGRRVRTPVLAQWLLSSPPPPSTSKIK
jgi:hypothetical protein